jgi:hypothetical protein
MVDKRVGIAVLLIISVGMWALAKRLGLLEPDSRRWQTCLFGAGWGVVLVLTVDLLEFGLTDATDAPMLLAFLALAGALGGGLSGLLISYLERHWPS